MGIKVGVSCTVLFILLDVVITTVLYTHGSHSVRFIEDVLNFNILKSVLDVWGTVLLRVSLLLGASIGVSWNKVDGPPRVASLATLILFICLIVMSFAVAKLLILTELGPMKQQPWALSLICWTFASSLVVMLLWRLLSSECSSVSRHHGSGSRGGVAGSEDTESLVGTDGEEEQEVGCERKKQKEEDAQERGTTSSGATLGRLIAISRKDGGLLCAAIFFLIISAVCECP